jgi:hypothetical protein
MSEPRAEFCTECAEPTGRSGEDDLFCPDCGTGPYCDECWATHRGEHAVAA